MYIFVSFWRNAMLKLLKHGWMHLKWHCGFYFLKKVTVLENIGLKATRRTTITKKCHKEKLGSTCSKEIFIISLNMFKNKCHAESERVCLQKVDECLMHSATLITRWGKLVFVILFVCWCSSYQLCQSKTKRKKFKLIWHKFFDSLQVLP